MTEETERELRHALGNAKAEKEALKSLLGRAADRLEDVVESQCGDEEQEKALTTARRIRQAIDRPKGDGSALPLASSS